MDIVESLKQMAFAGGEWVLWVLVVCSIGSIGIIIERILYFQKSRTDIIDFVSKLSAKLDSGDVEGAVSLAKFTKGIEAKVALAGLENFNKGHLTVEEIMIGKRLSEKLVLERNLMILGTLGNNAPFIGLFGTVLGIIKAFNDLAVSGTTGPSVVMRGISEALVATAVGLFVAIPAVIAYNYFQRKVKEFNSNSDTIARFILAHLKKKE